MILNGLGNVLKTIPKVFSIVLRSPCYLQIVEILKLGLDLREIMMWLKLTRQNTPPRSLFMSFLTCLHVAHIIEMRNY